MHTRSNDKLHAVRYTRTYLRLIVDDNVDDNKSSNRMFVLVPFTFWNYPINVVPFSRLYIYCMYTYNDNHRMSHSFLRARLREA